MGLTNTLSVKRIIKHNDLRVGNTTYNHSKLLEELIELSEVLVKGINKVPDKQPPPEKLVEEMGDVILRMDIIIEKYNLKEAISKRINEKTLQILKYAGEGKYKGGV